MADNKFPSLSSFLSSARKIEQATVDKAVEQNHAKTVLEILNSSSVVLSTYNQNSESPRVTAEFIQQGVSEAIAANSARVKSILDELFSSASVTHEREIVWINKFCDLFNIDKGYELEDKKALIEQQLQKDSDTLNYVTFLLERGE